MSTGAARFDWSGFVTQVSLDGRHTFCVPEDPDPKKGTGGIGLCGEFGIQRAIGYGEAGAGECFPKLGIGLLRKPDSDDYQFIRDYEIVKPFPVRSDISENQVTFTVEPVECNGYAARTTKSLRLAGNCLEIVEKIENLGGKPIQTEEYYHNFIGIDDQPLGPDYRLKFPSEWISEQVAESRRPRLLKRFMDERLLVVEGKEMTLRGKPHKAFYARSTSVKQTDQAAWEITHLPSGVSVREYDDFAPWRVAIWGAAHVVSAEVFIDLNVAAGKTQTWTRKYEFGYGINRA